MRCGYWIIRAHETMSVLSSSLPPEVASVRTFSISVPGGCALRAASRQIEQMPFFMVTCCPVRLSFLHVLMDDKGPLHN